MESFEPFSDILSLYSLILTSLSSLGLHMWLLFWDPLVQDVGILSLGFMYSPNFVMLCILWICKSLESWVASVQQQSTLSNVVACLSQLEPNMASVQLSILALPNPYMSLLLSVSLVVFFDDAQHVANSIGDCLVGFGIMGAELDDFCHQ